MRQTVRGGEDRRAGTSPLGTTSGIFTGGGEYEEAFFHAEVFHSGEASFAVPPLESSAAGAAIGLTIPSAAGGLLLPTVSTTSSAGFVGVAARMALSVGSGLLSACWSSWKAEMALKVLSRSSSRDVVGVSSSSSPSASEASSMKSQMTWNVLSRSSSRDAAGAAGKLPAERAESPPSSLADPPSVCSGPRRTAGPGGGLVLAAVPARFGAREDEARIDPRQAADRRIERLVVIAECEGILAGCLCQPSSFEPRHPLGSSTSTQMSGESISISPDCSRPSSMSKYKVFRQPSKA